jgi:hypothetical protein
LKGWDVLVVQLLVELPGAFRVYIAIWKGF